jgi:hypothetical protein
VSRWFIRQFDFIPFDSFPKNARLSGVTRNLELSAGQELPRILDFYSSVFTILLSREDVEQKMGI